MQDGSNSLSKWEIVRALIKTFPQFKGRGVNDLLDGFASIWPQLDPNNDGKNRGGTGGILYVWVQRGQRHQPRQQHSTETFLPS